MTARLGARLLALVLPVALLAPATAHAEKVVTQDATGDAVTFAADADVEDAVPAPDHTGTDIVRTVVALGPTRLRLDVHFRALERGPLHITVARIRTPRGGYDLLVERYGGSPIANLDRRSGAVECRGLKATVDLRADVVRVTLPASCLDAPRWVQLGVGAFSLDSNLASDDPAGAGYADDAHRTGEIRDELAWGPRVRRG